MADINKDIELHLGLAESYKKRAERVMASPEFAQLSPDKQQEYVDNIRYIIEDEQKQAKQLGHEAEADFYNKQVDPNKPETAQDKMNRLMEGGFGERAFGYAEGILNAILRGARNLGGMLATRPMQYYHELKGNYDEARRYKEAEQSFAQYVKENEFPSPFANDPNAYDTTAGKTLAKAGKLGEAAAELSVPLGMMGGLSTTAKALGEAAYFSLSGANEMTDYLEEKTHKFNPFGALGANSAKGIAMAALFGIMAKAGMKPEAIKAALLEKARANTLVETAARYGKAMLADGLKNAAVFGGSDTLGQIALEAQIYNNDKDAYSFMDGINHIAQSALNSSGEGFLFGMVGGLRKEANLADMVKEYGRENILNAHVRETIFKEVDETNQKLGKMFGKNASNPQNKEYASLKIMEAIRKAGSKLSKEKGVTQEELNDFNKFYNGFGKIFSDINAETEAGQAHKDTVTRLNKLIDSKDTTLSEKQEAAREKQDSNIQFAESLKQDYEAERAKESAILVAQNAVRNGARDFFARKYPENLERGMAIADALLEQKGESILDSNVRAEVLKQIYDIAKGRYDKNYGAQFPLVKNGERGIARDENASNSDGSVIRGQDYTSGETVYGNAPSVPLQLEMAPTNLFRGRQIDPASGNTVYGLYDTKEAYDNAMRDKILEAHGLYPVAITDPASEALIKRRKDNNSITPKSVNNPSIETKGIGKKKGIGDVSFSNEFNPVNDLGISKQNGYQEKPKEPVAVYTNKSDNKWVTERSIAKDYGDSIYMPNLTPDSMDGIEEKLRREKATRDTFFSLKEREEIKRLFGSMDALAEILDNGTAYIEKGKKGNDIFVGEDNEGNTVRKTISKALSNSLKKKFLNGSSIGNDIAIKKIPNKKFELNPSMPTGKSSGTNGLSYSGLPLSNTDFANRLSEDIPSSMKLNIGDIYTEMETKKQEPKAVEADNKPESEQPVEESKPVNKPAKSNKIKRSDIDVEAYRQRVKDNLNDWMSDEEINSKESGEARDFALKSFLKNQNFDEIETRIKQLDNAAEEISNILNFTGEYSAVDNKKRDAGFNRTHKIVSGKNVDFSKYTYDYAVAIAQEDLHNAGVMSETLMKAEYVLQNDKNFFIKKNDGSSEVKPAKAEAGTELDVKKTSDQLSYEMKEALNNVDEDNANSTNIYRTPDGLHEAYMWVSPSRDVTLIIHSAGESRDGKRVEIYENGSRTKADIKGILAGISDKWIDTGLNEHNSYGDYDAVVAARADRFAKAAFPDWKLNEVKPLVKGSATKDDVLVHQRALAENIKQYLQTYLSDKGKLSKAQISIIKDRTSNSIELYNQDVKALNQKNKYLSIYDALNHTLEKLNELLSKPLRLERDKVRKEIDGSKAGVWDKNQESLQTFNVGNKQTITKTDLKEVWIAPSENFISNNKWAFLAKDEASMPNFEIKDKREAREGDRPFHERLFPKKENNISIDIPTFNIKQAKNTDVSFVVYQNKETGKTSSFLVQDTMDDKNLYGLITHKVLAVDNNGISSDFYKNTPLFVLNARYVGTLKTLLGKNARIVYVQEKPTWPVVLEGDNGKGIVMPLSGISNPSALAVLEYAEENGLVYGKPDQKTISLMKVGKAITDGENIGFYVGNLQIMSLKYNKDNEIYSLESNTADNSRDMTTYSPNAILDSVIKILREDGDDIEIRKYNGEPFELTRKDGTKFSLKGKEIAPRQFNSVAEVKEALRGLEETVKKNANPNLKIGSIKVVANAEQMPFSDKAVEEWNEAHPDDKVTSANQLILEAVTDADGNITINASEVKSMDDVNRILIHEIGKHNLEKQILGEKVYDSIIENLLKCGEGNNADKEISSIIEEVKREDSGTRKNRKRLAEEVYERFTEKFRNGSEKFSARVKAFFRKVKNKVFRMLQKLGLFKGYSSAKFEAEMASKKAEKGYYSNGRKSFTEGLGSKKKAAAGNNAVSQNNNFALSTKGSKSALAKTVEKLKNEKTEVITKRALEELGTTDIWSGAGYLMPDGRLLDFSESNNGGEEGFRTLDHRNIGQFYDYVLDHKIGEENTGFMVDFMNRGNIRCLENGFDLSTKPTSEQRQAIRNFVRERGNEPLYIDFSDSEGKVVHSVTYYGEEPSRVVNDITRYFDEGIKPSGNNDYRWSVKGHITSIAKTVEKLRSDLSKAIPDYSELREKFRDGETGNYPAQLQMLDYITADGEAIADIDSLLESKQITSFEAQHILNRMAKQFRDAFPNSVGEKLAKNCLILRNAFEKGRLGREQIQDVTLDEVLKSPVQNIMESGSYAETDNEKQYENYTKGNRDYIEQQKEASEEGSKILNEYRYKYKNADDLSEDIDRETFRLSSKGKKNNSDTENKGNRILRWTDEKGKVKTQGRDPRYGVGKRISDNVWFHKNYAKDVVPSDVLKKATAILEEAKKNGTVPSDFTYNTMMYNPKTPSVLRFDETKDFDTAREPIPRIMFSIDTDTGKVKQLKTSQIFHSKWLWVKDDYKGFDVDESFNWSQKWKNAGLSNPSGYLDKWNAALKEKGLPVATETTDYSPAEKLAETMRGVEENYTQRYGSGATDVNWRSGKMPDTMRNPKVLSSFKKSGINLDMGGGAGEVVTSFLKDNYGVTNLVFDPFNRSAEHNKAIIEAVKNGGVDTFTCNNCLNVIAEEGARSNVILQCAKALKPDGKGYFLIYDASKSGIKEAKVTKKKATDVESSWQNARPAESYEPEIRKHFANVKYIGRGTFECSEPLVDGKVSAWQTDGTNPEAPVYKFSSKGKKVDLKAEKQKRDAAKNDPKTYDEIRIATAKGKFNLGNAARKSEYFKGIRQGFTDMKKLLKKAVESGKKEALDGFMQNIRQLNDYASKFVKNPADLAKLRKIISEGAKTPAGYAKAIRTMEELVDTRIRRDELADFRDLMREIRSRQFNHIIKNEIGEFLGEELTSDDINGLLRGQGFHAAGLAKLRTTAQNIRKLVRKLNEKNADGEADIPNFVKNFAGQNNIDKFFFDRQSDAELESWLKETISEQVPAAKVAPEQLAKINNILRQFVASQDILEKILTDYYHEETRRNALKIASELPKSKAPKESDYISGIFRTYLKPLAALESLDGENFTGMMGRTGQKIFHTDLVKGYEDMQHYQRQGYEILDNARKEYGKNWRDELNKPVGTVRSIDGNRISLTKGEAMCLVATALDPDTARLIEENGKDLFVLRRKVSGRPIRFTMEQIQAVADVLTPKDIACIENIRDMMETVYKPIINKAHEELAGSELTSRKGYFPRFSKSAGTDTTLFNTIAAPFKADVTTAEWESMAKHREEGGSEFIIGNIFDVAEHYIDQASLYAGMAVPVRAADRVLRNADFADNAKNALGAEYIEILRKRLAAYAGMAGYSNATVASKFIKKMIGQMAASKLTVGSALKQLTTVHLASSVIDTKYLARAWKDIGSKDVEARMMNTDLAYLRYRDGAMTALVDYGNKTFAEARDFARSKINSSVMSPFKWLAELSTKTDKRALMVIYRAAELQAEAEGKGQSRVLELFKQAVYQTQNTTDVMNANGYQIDAKSEIPMAMLNMYLNQQQKFGNNVLRLRNAIKEAKTPAEKKNARISAIAFGISSLAATWLGFAIDELKGKLLGRNIPKAEEERLKKRRDIENIRKGKPVQKESATLNALDTLFKYGEANTGNPWLRAVLDVRNLNSDKAGKNRYNSGQIFGIADLYGIGSELYGMAIEEAERYAEGSVKTQLGKKMAQTAENLITSKSAALALDSLGIQSWVPRWIIEAYKNYFVVPAKIKARKAKDIKEDERREATAVKKTETEQRKKQMAEEQYLKAWNNQTKNNGTKQPW